MNTARPHTAGPAPAAAHNDANAVRLLHDLVATPSVSGDERAAVECFVEHLRALGYRAHIDAAGNAVGERGGPDGADILLLGHIDTVPGDIPVRIEGDTLHGRGSVDAKGSLAAFAIAGARAELPPGARLTVIGAVGEEADSPGAAFVRDHSDPPIACVIGEPSGWDRCTLGYKGRLVVEAAFTRPCAHSSGPDATAPERAVAWWSTLRDDAEALNTARADAGVFDTLQITLQRIDTTSDGLTETTTAEIGYRLPTWITPETLESRLRTISLPPLPPGERPGEGDAQSTTRAQTHAHTTTAALPGHTGVPTHHPISLRFRAHAPCVRTDRSNALARAFFGAIADAGGRPRAVVKTGTSDMNTVGAHWGCPIVAYGPGDSALDHTPEERLDIPEYLRSIDVLRRAIESLGAEIATASRSR
ncbi:MAG: M20/M25/M40 family metallo-hydrolase [Phycisphaerales bacterium]|nr:MAG: M20/M25/M40 family metallo-hydrolase [Phycisphaerales bacterium]